MLCIFREEGKKDLTLKHAKFNKTKKSLDANSTWRHLTLDFGDI